jgi:hypothetical protein
MSVDAGIEVRRAIALLKSSEMIMGSRDRAFDRLVKDALACLENARGALGVGPAPVASSALDPSIVEWIFGAADAALAAAQMPSDALAPSTAAEVLAAALLSIREWAARLLQKPGQEPPSGLQGISTPAGPR